MVKEAQILYPNYALFICLYACIFVTIGVFFANILNTIFPKYDETKNKIVIYIEVLLQIISIAMVTYIFREYTEYFIKSFSFFKKRTYGSPDKFAALIIAPTMFSVQPNLIKKIKFLVNNVG